MYGKKKARLRQVNQITDDTKHLTSQQKYIDMLIDNVRKYFTKLDQEHKELTTLQAYLLAKKIQSEQGRKSQIPIIQNNEQSEIINSITLDLCSKLQGSEEEEDSE